MEVRKEDVTVTFPIYFVNNKQVCKLDSQTKCRFFDSTDYGYYCALLNEEIYTNSEGWNQSHEDCLMTGIYLGEYK